MERQPAPEFSQTAACDGLPFLFCGRSGGVLMVSGGVGRRSSGGRCALAEPLARPGWCMGVFSQGEVA